MKIILLNLPIPEFYTNFQRSNHQLFGTIFKSYLESLKNKTKVFKDILNDIEILTFPPEIIDRLNNKGILKEILEQKPDLVGFSNYLWNIDRNLYIAKSLKNIGIPTVAGGPEIQKDNIFLSKNNYFDYLIYGNGEIPLLNLILELKNKKYYHLKHDKNNKNILNKIIQNKYYLSDKININFSINQYIPYYLNFEDEYKKRKLLYLEIERGCPYKCNFCAYSGTIENLDTISIENFKKLIKNIFEKNVEEIYLLAPTLNRSKSFFETILEIINDEILKTNHNIKFFAELRPEALTINQIEKLSKANFMDIEFGVQSLNPVALKQSKRGLFKNFNPFKLAKLLKDFNIRPIIDFIIGLPGDNFDRLIETVNIIDKYNMIDYSNFYHLLLLAGTELKQIFDKLNYKYMHRPPYLMLNNKNLNINHIKNFYLYLETEKNVSYYDEFFNNNPENFFLLKHNFDEIKNKILNSNLLHTFLVIKTENIDFKILKEFYENYFRENPEVFHILYIITKNHKIKKHLSELLELKFIFKKFKNYYDYFHFAIDYFNDDFFSKRIEILTDVNNFETLNKFFSKYFPVNLFINPNTLNEFTIKQIEKIYINTGSYIYLQKSKIDDKLFYQINSSDLPFRIFPF